LTNILLLPSTDGHKAPVPTTDFRNIYSRTDASLVGV